MFSTKRKGIQSERYLKKRRKKFIWVAILFIVAIVSVITAMSLLSKASFLQIHSVVVINATTGIPLVTPVDQIQGIAESGIVGNRWYFFSKNTFLLYPKKEITEDILRTFPRVQSVDFAKDSSKNLDVLITERAPSALVCTEQTNAGKCFYMDGSGFVYAEAPTFSAGVYVRYTIASSTIGIGKPALTQSQLVVTRQAIDFLTKMNINVTGVTISNENDEALFIKDIYATSTPAAIAASSSSAGQVMMPETLVTTIYIATDDSFSTALNNFAQFWENSKNRNFEYVDLRYGNDIVYKLR